MPIDPEILLKKELDEVEGSWTEERVILYNIAVGSSQDPLNKSDLEFTVGSNPKVIPSFAACIYPMESVFSIIGSEGLEVSLTSLLHGEQKITIHKDIPSSGTAVTKATITAVEDYKKFASVTITSDSYMENEKITTAESVMLFIGEGGFGIKPENNPLKVSEISARFSGPVTPGNTLEIHSWTEEDYTIANVVEKETETTVLKDFILRKKEN